MKIVMQYKKIILIGAGILLILLLLIFGLRGCGVSHKSPEGVVKSLIKAYANGKEGKIKACYGVKKEMDETLHQEIDATIKYIKAHNPKNVEVEECDVLSEDNNYAYTYITYNLILENDQAYPCVSTYMTTKIDGKYYVLGPSDITDDMRKQASSDYAKFMTTNTYKEYTKNYETFIKKNPGYEDKIASKLS